MNDTQLATTLKYTSYEEFSKLLNVVNISTQGSNDDLRNLISKLNQYPKLVDKLEAKVEKAYELPYSLDSNDMLNGVRPWKSDFSLYLVTAEDHFQTYSKKIKLKEH